MPKIVRLDIPLKARRHGRPPLAVLMLKVHDASQSERHRAYYQEIIALLTDCPTPIRPPAKNHVIPLSLRKELSDHEADRFETVLKHLVIGWEMAQMHGHHEGPDAAFLNYLRDRGFH